MHWLKYRHPYKYKFKRGNKALFRNHPTRQMGIAAKGLQGCHADSQSIISHHKASTKVVCNTNNLRLPSSVRKKITDPCFPAFIKDQRTRCKVFHDELPMRRNLTEKRSFAGSHHRILAKGKTLNMLKSFRSPNKSSFQLISSQFFFQFKRIAFYDSQPDKGILPVKSIKPFIDFLTWAEEIQPRCTVPVPPRPISRISSKACRSISVISSAYW